MAEYNDSSWHLDKRVNVSLIASVIALGASGIWAWSNLTFAVEQLKVNMDVMKAEMDGDQKDQLAIDSRLIRLEEQNRSVLESLKEIKEILRQPQQRRPL